MVSGRGIACVDYEGGNGYAALIAEVDVNLETGLVRPTRFVVALDCGPISNPDGLRNQTEGGILQGMSRALVEEVTWDNRRITSTDWETYNSLHLDYEMPAIESVFVTPDGVPAIGAGETAITVTPAAIGNAIFDATGRTPAGFTFHSRTRERCAARRREYAKRRIRLSRLPAGIRCRRCAQPRTMALLLLRPSFLCCAIRAA